MSRQLEAERSRILKMGLRKLNAYALKIVGNTKQEGGIPDILACWDGRFIGIEVKIIKAPTWKLKYSGTQRRQLELINEAGGIGVGMAWCTLNEKWGLDYAVEGYVPQGRWYTLRDALEDLRQRD